MISLSDAIQLVYRHSEGTQEWEEVSLMESYGRVAAEDYRAKEDSPPWDTSALDGYAVRAEDVAAVPATLKVVADIPAGVYPDVQIGAGEAAKIMTGAPIPKGADTIIPVEHTSGYSLETVDILKPAQKGDGVRKQGENIHAGHVAIPRGTKINSKEMAILASTGYSRVRVFRRPKISILSTGDEIVDIEEPLRPGQIRNSNAYMLMSLCQYWRGETRILGIAKDTKEDVTQKIKAGLESDFLIITGGASVGERDFVKEVFSEEGVEIYFNKVNLKPGKPVVFGKKGNTHIFGLPGNPVSAFVTFLLLLERGLEKFFHLPQGPFYSRGRISKNMSPHSRERFLPAKYEASTGMVSPLPWKGSGDLFILKDTNCLLHIPPNMEVSKDSEVEFLPLSY
ncbi:MAG: molybdopterin molybdenumtransferase MoeA [Planctomycetota bacterium]|nr:MAG: molybdopterin molybdenumtransferase MoeA [Planctomycetota bacterium]